MSIRNLLSKRRSTRNFKNKKISYSDLDQIRETINNVNGEIISGNIRYRLYENGDALYDILEDKGGYAGVMIKSPHYITIEIDNHEKETILNSAYYAEKIVSYLSLNKIDSCWISLKNLGEDIKYKAFGEDKNHIDYIIGIGYGNKVKTFDGIKNSDRKPINEIVYKNEIGNPITLDELERRGLKDLFYYSSFAPSNKNLQPWRFILKNDRILLLANYKKWSNSILFDIGIIMFYFEELAHNLGIDYDWSLLENDAFIKDDEKYVYIAEYKI